MGRNIRRVGGEASGINAQMCEGPQGGKGNWKGCQIWMRQSRIDWEQIRQGVEGHAFIIRANLLQVFEKNTVILI